MYDHDGHSHEPIPLLIDLRIVYISSDVFSELPGMHIIVHLRAALLFGLHGFDDSFRVSDSCFPVDSQ